MNKELPKVKSRELTEKYSLNMTYDMKRKLEELKTFHDVDISTWIRSLIEEALKENN